MISSLSVANTKYHYNVDIVTGAGENMNASQFYFTLAPNLDSLDEKHTIFGEVSAPSACQSNPRLRLRWLLKPLASKVACRCHMHD